MKDGQYIKGGPASAAWNPAREETYNFIVKIVEDIISIFGNNLEYIHLGGDEVMKDTCWKPDPYVQQLMKDQSFTTTEQVFTYFLNKIGSKVRDATGK